MLSGVLAGFCQSVILALLEFIFYATSCLNSLHMKACYCVARVLSLVGWLKLAQHLTFNSCAGIITDLVSYYTLPSSVIGNDKYDSLKAAFMYYTVATETPLQDLMQDILIFARDR